MAKWAHIQRVNGEYPFEFCYNSVAGFKWQNYHIRYLSLGDDLLHLPLHEDEPVIASVEVVTGLFLKNGLKVPEPFNVPDSLLPFAGRTFRTMTMDEFRLDTQLPVFVKPAKQAKLFDGGCLTQQDTKRLAMSDVPGETLVLTSPEIALVSEFRVFIHTNRNKRTYIDAIRHYLGIPWAFPDMKRVWAMIAAFSSEAPVAYALDVGITASGETICVEVNDFWALGTYGMDPIAYTESYARRWEEMVTQARNVNRN